MPYITFDFSWLYSLGNMPLYEIIWTILANGGWVVFVFAILWGIKVNYYYIRNDKFWKKQNYCFLAIDVPKDNFQTPRAVENIFVAMAGIQSTIEWFEKLKGEAQLGFSCEIVSIDGFIQFLIRTPVQFRNLVEAAVYSQYPEAEITETSDYTADINLTFPNDEFNLWGADLIPTQPDYLPFFTYSAFQEILDKEFKDPLAVLLEVMSKIGPGEQIWFQIMIAPASVKWEKNGIAFVKKKLKIAEPLKKSTFDKVIESPITGLGALHDYIVGAEGAEPKKEEKFNMMFLPPHEKREVESVLLKIDKVCYSSKVRFIYLAKKEVFKKGLGVSGIMGAMKQFSSTALNSWKPAKNKTQASTWEIIFGLKDFLIARRQNLILQNYKKRNPMSSKSPYLLNVEELATMFHFPSIDLGVPLVSRVESKHSRAPIGLPTVEGGDIGALPIAADSSSGEKAPIFDYNNDFFESRFAIDKTRAADKARKEAIMKTLKKESGKEKQETSDQGQEIAEPEPNFESLKPKAKEDDVKDAGTDVPPMNLPTI